MSKEEFTRDLERNNSEIMKLGIKKTDANYFLPPYEWYNDTIADWTSQTGSRLINFTSGTSSNADYTNPDDKNYLSSDAILEKIKAQESKDPDGLNGFILLSHVGAGPKRTDKFYERLEGLIVWLRSKNYEMVRVDELLK